MAKKLTRYQEEHLEELEARAAKMFIEGNTPTPKWWLERIKEIFECDYL